ncbi:hypothetical protein [Chondromyces crocatus]|nr:hypothetical protein [Chondromyces crocatus]
MLIPSEHPPVSRSFSPFFAESGTTAICEARRLMVAAREILDGEDSDSAIEQAWYAVDGAARAAVDLVAAGSVPLSVVEVAAGLTGLARPKDYGVKALWALAWELLALQRREAPIRLLDEDALEMVASMEAACGPEAARELRVRFAEVEREEQRALGGGADDAAGVDPEEGCRHEREAAAYRIAVLGAGGSSRSDLAEGRALLWERFGREGDPERRGSVWEPLCRAFDVIGAGCAASLERLGALVDASPRSPALLWLDELACRVAREDARATRRAALLDEALGSAVFGRNAPSLAISVAVGRKRLREHGERIHEAWRRLAATRRGEGGGVAREEAEQRGPFHELSAVPPEVDVVLDDIAHALVLGFRELYGLELLQDALPRLEELLDFEVTRG